MQSSYQYVLKPEDKEPAMKMAVSLLKRWRCQINRDDVEGMVGVALVRAAAKFDPDRGTKFESFLFYYIKAELIKTIQSAIDAKKAVEALRDIKPDLFEESGKPKDENDSSQPSVLPDPDRISASASISPEKLMMLKERDSLIHQALERIPKEHRTIIKLVYFKQADLLEIKNELGLSRGGIKTALKRANKILQEELLNSGFEGI